jgi:4-hydroxy-3-methylbut-2-en-1-yl diphosphate reductase
VEVAERAGAERAMLVQGAADIPWRELGGLRVVGLSAGASAPEILVAEIVDAFRVRYDVTLDLAVVRVETEEFPVMRALRDVPLEPADMAFVRGAA